jgi:hypothetical protein
MTKNELLAIQLAKMFNPNNEEIGPCCCTDECGNLKCVTYWNSLLSDEQKFKDIIRLGREVYYTIVESNRGIK